MTYYTTAFKRAEDLSEDDVIKVGGQWREILHLFTEPGEMFAYFGIPRKAPEPARPGDKREGAWEREIRALESNALDRSTIDYTVVQYFDLDKSTPAEVEDAFVALYRKDLVEVQRAEPDHIREFTEAVALAKGTAS